MIQAVDANGSLRDRDHSDWRGRSVLAELGRSTKTEVRMRDRARIVLLAAEGVATREIGRIVGCTTGTARSGGCATRTLVSQV